MEIQFSGSIHPSKLSISYFLQLNFSFEVNNGTMVDFTDSSDESYELTITSSTNEEGEVSIDALVKASSYFVSFGNNLTVRL